MSGNKILEIFSNTKAPLFLIGEIGINHNGNIDNVRKMIMVAKLAGFDAIKLQKRTPEICVPENQKGIIRDTPWGKLTYLDYRYKVEFSEEEYRSIQEYCKSMDIIMLASPWDIPSAEFLFNLGLPAIKIPSAMLTNIEMLEYISGLDTPILISTGMSNIEDLDKALSILNQDHILIFHCTSTYPCPVEELNLNVIKYLSKTYDFPIGYSGHEAGLATSYAAVALGIKAMERHITLDRNMWGSDQKASIEPTGMFRFVRDIRNIEKALGDGIKKVYESEIEVARKLRYFSV